MSDEIQSTTSDHVQKTSGLAIVSLVCGVLGLTFLPLLGALVAVITAPLAKKEIRESDGTMSGWEIAQAGQILGWIGIGLSVIILCCITVLVIIPLSFVVPIFRDSYYYWLVCIPFQ